MTLKNQVTQVLKPLKTYKFITLAFCALSIIVGLLIPYAVGILLDEISRSLYFILYFSGLIAFIIFMDFFLEWVQNVMWFNLVYRSANLVRKYLYGSLVQKSIAFHKKLGIGDLSNKLLNDASRYAEIRAILMPMLFLNLLRISVVLIFLIIMNIWLAVICSLLFLFYLGIYTRLNKKLKIANKKLSETYSIMQERTNETLLNMDTIQLYRAQDFFAKRFGQAVDNHTQNQKKLQLWKSLGQTATSTTLRLIPVIAVVVGAVFFYYGTITLGQIVAFYAFLPQLGEPFRNLADFNMSYQVAEGLESRLDDLLIKPEEDESGKPVIDKIDSIKLKNVQFSYSTDKVILKGLNLSLRKGDVLGVVGSSGAGKSTLLRILMNRLLSEGVFVNDMPMNAWNPNAYFSRIAVLPQEVFLFDGDIADNVSFGREKGNLKNALKIAEAHKIYGNTLSLSGGEKQRIGLARTLYEDVDVLLLDEPTSALDETTEKMVVENLKKFLESNKLMVVIVSHRPKILSLCNKTLTLV
ncbi:MAG: ABC transporter ATP-binding protein/permease [Defluviitaleaceae bacterium]|nr:ABC transporter ATP-binding protein/permease [Defluviitaleaceae bacterium]